MIIIDPAQRTITRVGEPTRSRHTAAPSDIELDAARRIGDPLVDPLISEYLATHGPQGFNAVASTLFRVKGLPEEHPLVSAYLETLGDIELGESEIIVRGQQLFSLFGPEIFLILGSCSLPLAFAAGNGVQVIYRARRLKDEPVRRLYDTAQMVINVMQAGELAQDKVGWRTTRKVRLIHALIRWQVQSDPAAPWSGSWGTPINQEDLAGTLLSFSIAVLYGLRRMGARISNEQADSYVYAWSAVGRLLGIDEALLPGSEQGASILAARIGSRQIHGTPEGKLLTEQLMKTVATLLPLPGYANSLSHFFLENTAFGEDVVKALDLPAPGWTKLLVAARAWQKRKSLALLDIVPGARRRRSFLARRFVQGMILLKQQGGDQPFEIPEELAKMWRLSVRKTS